MKIIERDLTILDNNHLEKLWIISKDILNKKISTIKLDDIYAILLIQWAAKHFIDKKNGIKDFDILVLCKTPKKIRKVLKWEAFWLDEFWINPNDKWYKNRRIDLIIRWPYKWYEDYFLLSNKNINSTLIDYFNINHKQNSMKCWKIKPIIWIYPKEIEWNIIYNIYNPKKYCKKKKKQT